MPRPSAAASRASVQMQGFHPTICGLPSARDRPTWRVARPARPLTYLRESRGLGEQIGSAACEPA